MYLNGIFFLQSYYLGFELFYYKYHLQNNPFNISLVEVLK
jgi:hypothetical protein